MGVGSIVMIALTVFVVFTLTIGGGIVFYEQGIAQYASHDNPTSSLISQAALIVIVLMFLGGAILFLAGAVRWVAKNQ